jgi:hypothetical protein
VVRCKGKITNLYIISKDNKDFFHFSLLSGKKGGRVFNIKELNNDYFLKTMHAPVNLHYFQLRPETEYEIINHSNGDAVDGKILIRTNKSDSVAYANKTSCTQL